MLRKLRTKFGCPWNRPGQHNWQNLVYWLKNFFWQKMRIDAYKNYWSPKCDDNTNIVTCCKETKMRTPKISRKKVTKRKTASFIINTIREKLMPLEIPNRFSHYIFCWLYQRLDLKPASKRRWISSTSGKLSAKKAWSWLNPKKIDKTTDLQLFYMPSNRFLGFTNMLLMPLTFKHVHSRARNGLCTQINLTMETKTLRQWGHIWNARNVLVCAGSD